MSGLANIARPDGLDAIEISGGAGLVPALVRAAERVFHHAPVAPDDDLFDMGCDSITALALTLEIEHITGRGISPAVIFDAPTIRGIATYLSRTSPGGSGAPILLRAGDPAEPPVFMAPGLGSSVMQLKALANALDCDGPVYGLEPRGLGEDGTPFDRIDDMAADFAGKIFGLCPDGRCHLVGFCYGGIVALEVTRKMLMSPALPSCAEANRLILINTYPHTRYWPVFGRLKTWLKLVAALSPRLLADRFLHHHVPVLRALPLHQAIPRAMAIFARATTLPLRIFGLSAYMRETRPALPAAAPALASARLQRVTTASATAFRAYMPGAYGGPTLLITPSAALRLPFDPTRFWKRRMPGIHVQRVYGDYAELLGMRLPEVAGAISHFVKRQDLRWRP